MKRGVTGNRVYKTRMILYKIIYSIMRKLVRQEDKHPKDICVCAGMWLPANGGAMPWTFAKGVEAK